MGGKKPLMTGSLQGSYLCSCTCRRYSCYRVLLIIDYLKRCMCWPCGPNPIFTLITFPNMFTTFRVASENLLPASSWESETEEQQLLAEWQRYCSCLDSGHKIGHLSLWVPAAKDRTSLWVAKNYSTAWMILNQLGLVTNPHPKGRCCLSPWVRR